MATKGSFMLLSEVKQYNEQHNLGIYIHVDKIELIGECAYIPTDVIKNQLPEQDWKKMECEVTTLVLESEPILNTGSGELTETEIFERFKFGGNRDRLHFVTREYED